MSRGPLANPRLRGFTRLARPGTSYRVNGLALTFDDGPDPVWTARLLDLLADLGARATFFPITSRAAAAPELITRMLGEGHAVGLHCREHVRHVDRDAAWLRADTRAALATLAALGVSAVLWRTPWGVTAPWTREVAQEQGLDLVGWSVDTHDWRGDGAEAMFASTADQLQAGSVVLAHDGIGPGARRQTPEQTLGYVERVAELAHTRELSLVALGPGGGVVSSTLGDLRTVTDHLGDVLAALELSAGERDRTADGLDDGLAQLAQAGVLAANARGGETRPPAVEELALVRAVARADSSVGRVLDGHLNGVERLIVQAPAEIAEAELPLVRAGRLRVGVWGGNPRPHEGEPAHVERVAGEEVLSGVKTWCSGAGSLDRALVLARDLDAEAAGVMAPVAVWIDLRDAGTVQTDPSWYQSSGLRASASHRVIFDRAPVLARFGGPGAITTQPWFGRDALRTAASWAGMADAAVSAALAELAAAPRRGPLEEYAAGRMLGAQRTIDVWLAAAAAAMDAAAPDLWDVALHGRVAIAEAAQLILAEASRACGSHPFATAGALDRVRRDLELFLLQHRLDPPLQRAGATALDAAAPMTVASAFDRRYADDADPWGYEHSGYEQAKYAATLAACGDGPFHSALELGASIGVFSALLAPRCEQLITEDFSSVAVAQARERLAHLTHVDVRVGEIPADLTDGTHDLIVASEILYYLAPSALDATLDRLAELLAPGGRLVLVHWRPSGPERPFSAAQVHARVRALPWLAEQLDASTEDYLLHVLVRA